MIRASDRHIIARRTIWPEWGEDDAWRPVEGCGLTIGAAQDAYDRGEIELAQGRHGDETALYAIPRRERAVRTPWFGRRIDVPAPRALGLR